MIVCKQDADLLLTFLPLRASFVRRPYKRIGNKYTFSKRDFLIIILISIQKDCQHYNHLIAYLTLIQSGFVLCVRMCKN